MDKPNIEIEKKYIIKMPALSYMEAMEGYTKSEIIQIYLESPKEITHRVRSRKIQGKTVYTETRKVRIDKMSAYEDEHEISPEEFISLSEKIDRQTRPIKKARHTFIYLGQLFEIDIYPEWKNTGVLETELESRETVVDFPDFIDILKDVTGDKRYSNASMSRSFPAEEM